MATLAPRYGTCISNQWAAAELRAGIDEVIDHTIAQEIHKPSPVMLHPSLVRADIFLAILEKHAPAGNA